VLGSFRIRMLVVVLIAMLVGLSIQSDHSSRYVIETVLNNYVLKDYGVETKLALLVENTRSRISDGDVPVMTQSEMQSPCDYLTVARRYGWNWNEESRQQEFYPGVLLIVKENTLVRPILAGEVVEVSRQEDVRTILIKHSPDLFSYYQGLQEVLVRENQYIDQRQVLGKTGKKFYFELRDQDGPMDPHSLFP
jgi:murein DD-endopeptidase MepM/ murein hydrolase activator NlpD